MNRVSRVSESPEGPLPSQPQSPSSPPGVPLSGASACLSGGHMAAGLLPRGVGLFAPCPRPWLSSRSAPLPVKLCLEMQSDFSLSLVRPGVPVGLVTHLASFCVSTALTERAQKSFPIRVPSSCSATSASYLYLLSEYVKCFPGLPRWCLW